MKAVIDRIEENYAILLFGDDEVKVDVPVKLLPKDAKEGIWLNVNFEVDEEGTKKQEEKIKGLLDKLKNKK